MQVVSFQEFLREIHLQPKVCSFHQMMEFKCLQGKGTANSTTYKDILENWEIPTLTAWGKLFCYSMSMPLYTKPAL